MSDDFTVEIKGLSDLQLALEDLPVKVAKHGLRSALKSGAAPIKEAMVTGAPHDTGFMSEHFDVKLKINRDELAGSAFIGPQGKIDYPAYTSGAYKIIRSATGRAKKVGAIAVATIVRFFEFGTSKMSKKPFMTQAFEGHKDQALANITQELTNAVAVAAAESPKGPSAPAGA